MPPQRSHDNVVDDDDDDDDDDDEGDGVGKSRHFRLCLTEQLVKSLNLSDMATRIRITRDDESDDDSPERKFICEICSVAHHGMHVF